AQQQRGHAPEGEEQEWILLGIVVRGVRQVSGELAVRAGMALSTGFDDVVAAEPRALVVHWQNVVRAVAVVTLGGLEVTQFGNFPVESLEITVGDLAVAAAALVHDVQPEVRQVRALNAVGGMAIRALRQFLPGMRDIRAVDAGVEQLVDANVALRTGARDVGAIDAGAGIAARQLVMRG